MYAKPVLVCMDMPMKLSFGSCYVGSEKEHDMYAKLVKGCSQTVGRNRAAEEWGGGLGEVGAGRPCAATVTCHAWHSGGRAAGGQRKHHLPGTVGVRAG